MRSRNCCVIRGQRSRLGTTELDLLKQKLSKAIVELYIVLAGEDVPRTSQLIGEEGRSQQGSVFVRGFFCAASVNYAACELEHLLLQITPELIFLQVLSPPASIKKTLISNSSSSSRCVFAVTVIRPRPDLLQPSVAGSLWQRIKARQGEKDAPSFLFTHLCISDGAQPVIWLENLFCFGHRSLKGTASTQRGTRESKAYPSYLNDVSW